MSGLWGHVTKYVEVIKTPWERAILGVVAQNLADE